MSGQPDSDHITRNAAVASSGGPPVSRASGRRAAAFLIVSGLLLSGWLATGLFVVDADEVAVVRVCGRVQRDEAGHIVLKPGGLYFHLPPPFTRIDRIRINEAIYRQHHQAA